MRKQLNLLIATVFFILTRPILSTTANFNSYVAGNFDDAEQIRLYDLCQMLDQRGCLWLLSNSDVRQIAPENHFFDELYQNFHINRVRANRRINANASHRHAINELLISNYLRS